MAVEIDEDLCIGFGECGRIVPSAFQLDEIRGVSAPLPGAASADLDLLIDAGRSCPMNAILVTDEDGTVLVNWSR